MSPNTTPSAPSVSAALPAVRVGSRPAAAMTVSPGCLRVADGDADRGDDRAAHRHLDQRACERDVQEALADDRDEHELAGHDDICDEECLGEVADEERQRVQRATQEGGDAGDDATLDRAPAAGELAVV